MDFQFVHPRHTPDFFLPNSIPFQTFPYIAANLSYSKQIVKNFPSIFIPTTNFELFQNSRINRKKSDSKIRLFNFLLLQKKKRKPKTLVSSNFDKEGQTLSEKDEKKNEERERERGKLEKSRVVSRMNQKVRRRKWGLSTGHDLKPNITTEGTFLEHVPSQCSPQPRGAGVARDEP